MILESGAKVLVVHRRLFENDVSRFFVGTVDAYEAGMARVTGFTFTKDPFIGGHQRKPEPRTKIMSLSSGTLIVYQLPNSIDISKLRYEHDRDGRVFLLDDANFKMDLTETTFMRRPVAL